MSVIVEWMTAPSVPPAVVCAVRKIRVRERWRSARPFSTGTRIVPVALPCRVSRCSVTFEPPIVWEPRFVEPGSISTSSRYVAEITPFAIERSVYVRVSSAGVS